LEGNIVKKEEIVPTDQAWKSKHALSFGSSDRQLEDGKSLQVNIHRVTYEKSAEAPSPK
jgi:hypothetical protein